MNLLCSLTDSERGSFVHLPILDLLMYYLFRICILYFVCNTDTSSSHGPHCNWERVDQDVNGPLRMFN